MLVIQISYEEPLQTHTKKYSSYSPLLIRKEAAHFAFVVRQGELRIHPVYNFIALLYPRMLKKGAIYWWPVNFFIKLFHNLLFSISEIVVISGNHNL